MASHLHHHRHYDYDHHLRRHHHDHHHDNKPLAAAVLATPSCCCCCGDSSPCCTPSRHPPPPVDHLLHLVVSYLQQQQQQRQCPDQTHFCETSRRGFNGFKQHRFLQQQKNVQRDYDHFVLSCLLRRIDDLESSLHRFSASSENREVSYCSLRDSAARVIQTHFRAYLVRRSRSLRQLKELATIKSSFLSLRSSVSVKTHVPFEAVSREAMDLLQQLDSIRGSDDPMIRDGKRSLSRDLVMFLKYLDGFGVKRHETIRKAAKNGFVGSSSRCRSAVSKYQNFGIDKAKNVEKVGKRIEKIYMSSSGDEGDNVDLHEFQCVTDDGEEMPMILVNNAEGGSSKSGNGVLMNGNGLKSGVTKTVKFKKNGSEYRVYGDAYEPNSSGDDVSNNDGDEICSIDNGKCGSLKPRKEVLVKGNGLKSRATKFVRFNKSGNEYRVYDDTDKPNSHENDDSNADGEEIEVISVENEKVPLWKIRKGVPVKGSRGKIQVVKTVSFDENGNTYKVYGNTPQATSSGEDDDSTNGSNDENGERKGNGCNEVEEIKCVPKESEVAEEKAHSENEEESSSQGSDSVTIRGRNVNHLGRNEYNREFRLRNTSLMFSPPQPQKMEP